MLLFGVSAILTTFGVILGLVMLALMVAVVVVEFVRSAPPRVRPEAIDPGCPGCGGVYLCACPKRTCCGADFKAICSSGPGDDVGYHVDAVCQLEPDHRGPHYARLHEAI